jgi:hypothetical protein
MRAPRGRESGSIASSTNVYRDITDICTNVYNDITGSVMDVYSDIIDSSQNIENNVYRGPVDALRGRKVAVLQLCTTNSEKRHPNHPSIFFRVLL